MGGVALASCTELSFSWLGFSTAMASNAAFSARGILSKKLMSKMSPLNLYNFVTIVSLLFWGQTAWSCHFGTVADKMSSKTRR